MVGAQQRVLGTKIEETLKSLLRLPSRLRVFGTGLIQTALAWRMSTLTCLFSMFVKRIRAKTFLLGLLSGI